jgi:hypothetical protein
MGVAVALRRWFSMNHEERLAVEEDKRSAFARGLAGISGVTTSIPKEAQLGPNVTVFIHFDAGITGIDGHEVIKQLEEGDPPIWTRTHDDGGSIGIGVQMLSDEEVETVVERLRDIFA